MHLAESRPEPSCRIGHVGEGVVDRVDRVAEAAFLADLVEQARAHRAAEQRRVDRQRGSFAHVADDDVWPVDHPQVRLVGVALLDELLGLERRGGLVGVGRGQRGKATEQLLQLASCGQVLEVADEEGAAAGARPATLAEGDDALAREAAQVLLRAEHGPPERVIAERGSVDQVLGDHRGLVVGAVDLLDHDAALAVELLGVDPRAARRSRSAGRSPRARSRRAR